MDHYSIKTTQNISIDHSFASIGERLVAAAIDFMIMGAYGFVLAFFGNALSTFGLLAFVMALPVLLYHLLFEVMMNGQSPGKKVMKIKVVSEYGTNPPFVTYFVRWVFRLIDITLLFGSVATIFIITSEKKQRLGDMAANTVLIRLGKRLKTKSIYVELPENYEPVFQSAGMLSEKDVYTIKEVLEFAVRSFESREADAFALKTRESLERKLGIKSDLRTMPFLKTIIKDYNYQKINRQ